MSYFFLTPRVSKRLTTFSTNIVFEPYTDWIPAIGVDRVKGFISNTSVNGEIETKIAIQTAAVRTDAPGAWEDFDASWNTGAADRMTGVDVITTYTASNFFFRLGIAYRLPAGATATYGAADVALQVSFDSEGDVVGVKTVQAQAEDAEVRYLPLTKWVPASGAAKVKAAFVAAGIQNAFACRLAWRTAAVFPASPDAWTSLDTAKTSAPWEWNTGELSPTITDKMWIQFGLEYYLNSGTGTAEASVTAAIATRT